MQTASIHFQKNSFLAEWTEVALEAFEGSALM